MDMDKFGSRASSDVPTEWPGKISMGQSQTACTPFTAATTHPVWMTNTCSWERRWITMRIAEPKAGESFHLLYMGTRIPLGHTQNA